VPSPENVRHLWSFSNEASLPTTGLTTGDRAYCEAEGTVWRATSDTAWALVSHNHDAAYSAAGHSHPGGGGEAFPVGSIFISAVSTNPATLLGYGTWAAFGAGRVLVGRSASDPDFDTAEETGGAKTHTLTVAEMPAHVHREQRHATTTGSLTGPTTAPDTSSSNPADWGVDTASTGGGGAHNNMPPYIVVYMWKRTA
jgi:hypothetical protein